MDFFFKTKDGLEVGLRIALSHPPRSIQSRLIF